MYHQLVVLGAEPLGDEPGVAALVELEETRVIYLVEDGRAVRRAVVVGPVIMVIGLILAPVAVHMAIGKTGDGSAVLVPEKTALIVSMTTLVATILISLLGRGLLRLIPILIGVGVGYLVSIPFGLIDLSPVAKAAWVAVPNFVFPSWNLEAVIFIVPVAIAPAIEIREANSSLFSEMFGLTMPLMMSCDTAEAIASNRPAAVDSAAARPPATTIAMTQFGRSTAAPFRSRRRLELSDR